MDICIISGVTSLNCLLLSAKDEDAPKLHVLLCEALLSVYVSLLMNALCTYDTAFLYRLLSNKLTPSSWGLLFGGGCRTALRVEQNIPSEKLSSEFYLFQHGSPLPMVMASSQLVIVVFFFFFCMLGLLLVMIVIN